MRADVVRVSHIGLTRGTELLVLPCRDYKHVEALACGATQSKKSAAQNRCSV